jgi:hypothetical protein
MYGEPKFLLVDILVEHYEELEFLWGQRLAALQSPLYILPELLDLEERIESHVQGLLVSEEQMIPLVEEGLSSDDSLLAFAASYALLRLNSKTAAQQVMDTLFQAEAGQLDGIRQAMCYGPIAMIREQLREAFAAAPAPTAVAAAEALAFHHQVEPRVERLGAFLQDENTEVRQAVWRVIAMLDSTLKPQQASVIIPSRPYEAALRDEDPAVRRAAMQAAAWTRQEWLL